MKINVENVLVGIEKLVEILPRIIGIVNHYTSLVNDGKLTGEDKVKAEAYLKSLKWTPWEDING